MAQLCLLLKSYQGRGEVGFTIIDESPDRLTADISFPSGSYSTTTFKDFKAKLPSYWPKLTSNAIMRDMFGGEQKLNDYSLLIDSINPPDNGPTLTHKLTVELAAGTHLGDNDHDAEKSQPKPAPQAASYASAIPASTFEGLDCRVHVHVEGGKVTFDVSGKTATGYTNKGLFTVPIAEFDDMKFAAIKTHLGDGWPSWGRGGSVDGKDFYDFKTLKDFGVGPGIHQINFKINSDPTAKSAAAAAPVSAPAASSYTPAPAPSSGAQPGHLAKRPGKDLTLTISMYMVSGTRTLVTTAECTDLRFKKTNEIKVTIDDFPNYTWKNFKDTFPEDWPKTQVGGTFVGSSYVDFDDSQTLLATGLRGSNIETKFYDVILKVDPNAVSSAPVVSPIKVSSVPHIPNEKRFAVELRTYGDSKDATVIASATTPYHYNEITMPQAEFKALTFAGLKKALSTRGWPDVQPGGIYQDKGISDDTTLSDAGIGAYTSASSHFAVFELKKGTAAAAPVSPRQVETAHYTLGRATSAVYDSDHKTVSPRPKSPRLNWPPVDNKPAPSGVSPRASPAPAATTPTKAPSATIPASGGTKFCEECGTKASSMATKFCGGCGAKFSS